MFILLVKRKVGVRSSLRNKSMTFFWASVQCPSGKCGHLVCLVVWKLVTGDEVRCLVSEPSPQSHFSASPDMAHEKYQATLAQSLKQFVSLEKPNLSHTLFPKYLIQRGAREKLLQDLAFWCSYLTWKQSSHVNAACGIFFSVVVIGQYHNL